MPPDSHISKPTKITVFNKSGRSEEHVGNPRIAGCEKKDGLGINGFTVVTDKYWHDVKCVDIA